jgi:hypothetical protein
MNLAGRERIALLSIANEAACLRLVAASLMDGTMRVVVTYLWARRQPVKTQDGHLCFWSFYDPSLYVALLVPDSDSYHYKRVTNGIGEDGRTLIIWATLRIAGSHPRTFNTQESHHHQRNWQSISISMIETSWTCSAGSGKKGV